jgi:integrase
MKLTQPIVNGLVLPTGKNDHTYWDDDIPGFGVRLRAGGSKVWVYRSRIGRRQPRITLGPTTAMTLVKARGEAQRLHLEVRLGRDPAAAKRAAVKRAAETFGAWLEQPYLARQAERLKPRSMIELRRHLLVSAKPLHPMAPAEIDRRAVASLLARIQASNGAATAKAVRSAVSAYFAWLMGEGLAESNPVIGTNNYPAMSRDRVMTDGELVALWKATADGSRFSAIVRLLLLCACRREEIGGLRWDEVDLENAMISLPSTRTKSGKPLDLPLPPAAVAILAAQPRRPESAYVFGWRGAGGFRGWSKVKAELDSRLGFPAWRLHDLRRTVATGMNRIGIEPHVVEECLNHAGARRGVAGVYNRWTYLPQKATALARWSEHLRAIVEERPGTVVGLCA